MSKLKRLTIQEIHKYTLGNLKKIIEICELLSIDYFIAYGTLIGAVRHRGFIPWDDDLDIMMMRQDYEKFCSYCKKNTEIIKPYKLIDKYSNSSYPYNIPRFCDTRFIMKRNDNIPVADMGVFVDIYPLDKVENFERLKDKFFRMRKKVNMILWDFSLTNHYTTVHSNMLLSIIKAPIVLGTHLMGKKYFLANLEKLKSEYHHEECRYVDCLIWNERTSYFNKEWFQGYEYMEFEGIQVKVPKYWNEVLTKIYGDYMKLPPLEKQIPTHDYELYYK